MSKRKQIVAWIAIIGGVIGFFFFSIEMAEMMR
jgi:LPS O-antigen subunit length determinant protein (WzzB/FepE family)